MSAGTLVLTVTAPPERVAAALRDPEAAVGDDVVAVTTDGEHSRWELVFRGHPLRWTQSDARDGDTGTARLVAGDLSTLRGAWRVEPRDDGATVRLEYEVATSMAHLAGAIDPMVLRVLLRTLRSTVEAAGGASTVEEGGELLADPVVTGTGP